MEADKKTVGADVMTAAPIRLDIKRTVLVGLAFFTITMFWEVYDSVMPLFLHDFGLSGLWSGVVMALDNVLALVLLPFMGLLSDRFPLTLRAKFGRRIPFIVCGSVLAAVAFLFVNWGHNAHNFAFLMTATVFVLLFMCLYRTPAVALMPDVTPKSVRSQGNTVINIMGTVGGVITLLLMTFLLDKKNVSQSGNWALTACIAGAMVLSAVIMVFKVRENKLVEEKAELLRSRGITEDDADAPAQKPSLKSAFASLNGAQLRSLLFILASVFLWYTAYNGVKTHFSVFALYVIDVENFTLPLLVANAAAFIMFVPASVIGKKIGRSKTVMLGVLMLIAGFGSAALLLLFGNKSLIQFSMYPAFMLVGGGWATINVHSYVMSVEMATEKTTGTFTGLYYTFVMSAQIITPILAGAVMDFKPELLMLYSAVFSVLALVTMSFVKHGNVSAPPPAAEKSRGGGES
ncbi:MAG: MFS transporter [Clostridiales bacterium]|jgi:MFS family permease|nr:MFS transporter [Clostridiales bacterium]